MLTPDGHEPPVQRGGMGDHTTAITAASAICVALVAWTHRPRVSIVVTSLLRAGMYVRWDVATRLRFDTSPPPGTRRESPESDRQQLPRGVRSVVLADRPRGGPALADVCRAPSPGRTCRPIRAPPTSSSDARTAPEVVRILEEEGLKRPPGEWARGLRDPRGRGGGRRSRPAIDIANDPQVLASGGVVAFDVADGLPEQLATPVIPRHVREAARGLPRPDSTPRRFSSSWDATGTIGAPQGARRHSPSVKRRRAPSPGDLVAAQLRDQRGAVQAAAGRLPACCRACAASPLDQAALELVDHARQIDAFVGHVQVGDE